MIRLALSGFWRVSNHCAHNANQFDRTKHFTRQDIVIAPPGLVLKLMWSKMPQTALQSVMILIPTSKTYLLAAVQAFKRMTTLIPADPTLFLLIVSQLRNTFNMLLVKAYLHSEQYTPLDQRGGYGQPALRLVWN